MENFKTASNNDNKIIKLIEQVRSFIALRSTIVDDAKALKQMDELINFYKKMVPSKMQHPVNNAYHGGKDGGLFSDYTKKWSNRKANSAGYIGDQIYTNGKIKCMKRHRMIYECYYGVILDDDAQIDHIDSDKSNNEIWNLQKLTTKEHGQKTHGGKESKSKFKTSKPVTRFKINESGEEIDVVTYNSASEASISIGCNSFDIVNVLKGRLPNGKNILF